MSELIVQPIRIEEIKPHPHADRLEIAVVGGWEIITGKDNYGVGDIVVHVQPDNMVPRPQAEAWGVDKYLSFKKNSENGRVRAARLRGITSFGFLVPNDTNAELGTDLAEHYGITKYDPPQNLGAGITAKEHFLFHHYTDIENLRNHKDSLNYGHELVVTEKIHGTNSRVGWVRRMDDNISGINMSEHFDAWRDSQYEFVVGSHNSQREIDNCGIYGVPIDLYKDRMDEVFKLVLELLPSGYHLNSLIFFGEVFGAGVQDLHYGAKTAKEYRLFDICVNGKYLTWDRTEAIAGLFGIPTVPVLKSGNFSFQDLVELAQGDTTLCADQIREGIVIRPMRYEFSWQKDTLDPDQRRMIFKLLSDEYLLRKGGTEFH